MSALSYTDKHPMLNIDYEVELRDNNFPTQESSNAAIDIRPPQSPSALKSSFFIKLFNKVTLPNRKMRVKCKYFSQSSKF